MLNAKRFWSWTFGVFFLHYWRSQNLHVIIIMWAVLMCNSFSCVSAFRIFHKLNMVFPFDCDCTHRVHIFHSQSFFWLTVKHRVYLLTNFMEYASFMAISNLVSIDFVVYEMQFCQSNWEIGLLCQFDFSIAVIKAGLKHVYSSITNIKLKLKLH